MVLREVLLVNCILNLPLKKSKFMMRYERINSTALIRRFLGFFYSISSWNGRKINGMRWHMVLLAFCLLLLCSCNTGSRREGMGYLVPINDEWSIAEKTVLVKRVEMEVALPDNAIDSVPVISRGVSKELSNSFSGEMRFLMYNDSTVEMVDSKGNKYVVGRWAKHKVPNQFENSISFDLELFGMVYNDWFEIGDKSMNTLFRFGYVEITLAFTPTENYGIGDLINVKFRDIESKRTGVNLSRERVRPAFTRIMKK